jgi:hypothetical protein
MNPLLSHTAGDDSPDVANGKSFPPAAPQAVVDSPAHNRFVPTTSRVDERDRFESLLADLSATFVKIPASEVDQ